MNIYRKEHKLLIQDYPFLIREPDYVYHQKRKDYLSSHSLQTYMACPLLFRKKELGMVKEIDGKAYKIGRAAHKLVLEGSEAYDFSYAVGGPVNPKTGKSYGSDTKKYAQWEGEQGKTGLTHEEAALVENMVAGIAMNEKAKSLLDGGFAECVIRREYTGVKCQIRMDWFSPVHGLVDLKTCENLEWFEYDVKKFSYIYQLAFYRAVLEQASEKRHPVHLVAVEKREPFRCGVWKIGEEALSIAQRKNEEAIQNLIRSRVDDNWPTGYEDMRSIDSL